MCWVPFWLMRLKELNRLCKKTPSYEWITGYGNSFKLLCRKLRPIGVQWLKLKLRSDENESFWFLPLICCFSTFINVSMCYERSINVVQESILTACLTGYFSHSLICRNEPKWYCEIRISWFDKMIAIWSHYGKFVNFFFKTRIPPRTLKCYVIEISLLISCWNVENNNAKFPSWKRVIFW